MTLSSPKFITALIVAVAYMIIAAAFVREDRKTSTGGFINLQGMVSALATMPVAFPLEYAGHKLNFRSNLQMAAAILCCGALVFFSVYGVLALGSAAFASKPVAP